MGGLQWNAHSLIGFRSLHGFSREESSARELFYNWVFQYGTMKHKAKIDEHRFIVSVNLFLAPLLGLDDWTELTRNLEPETIRTLIGISGGALLVILGYILPIRIWMPRLKGNFAAQAMVPLFQCSR